MIKKITGVLAGGMILFYGCYNDKEEILYGASTCDGVNASFVADVNPIIQSSCAKPDCHAAGSTNGPGALTSYTQIKNAATQIKSAVVSRFMPEDGSLTQSQIKSISCWVDSGAPNN
ncbi:hypothetical protein A4H97_05680 [Niastella yeongjuensis]|uniref:Cytochrome c domain-containing protein n=1 Tax=Niastella yeongjuensis TaxID=354355 RepID=A0A1V9ELI5_9BACT|nr:hypothetical protein [Niastella yeongjuensis]OQP47007.1 hypothetical protein A4H97_05680 [Niastella yeongjuensis]SEN65214.1 hypothetical protein SAMN05660816_01161 [Niastella yeongjuensis]